MEYFKQSDTPMEHSPVGELLVKILKKFPGMSFQDARVKAKDLLSQAAGKRFYGSPVVLSEVELAEQRLRLAKAFGKAA